MVMVVAGKTQVINEFFVTNNCYIVDLATNRLHLALKLVWALCHGLASVKLIQHYLRTFPSCASIGTCAWSSAVSNSFEIYSPNMGVVYKYSFC
ncbi:hypothetical protein JHK87_053069 [Glycine soja]|nr:hypothetical protein JHK87_053069 [Glycine soja]